MPPPPGSSKKTVKPKAKAATKKVSKKDYVGKIIPGYASDLSMSLTTSNRNACTTKGAHWRKDEIEALILGANHLKPVLRGKFKDATCGASLKEMAWKELAGQYKKTTTILSTDFVLCHVCCIIILYFLYCLPANNIKMKCYYILFCQYPKSKKSSFNLKKPFIQTA